MGWIIGVIVLIIMVFLWLIVRSAARSVDEDTQAMYDEEQSRYIEEYFKEKQKNQQGRADKPEKSDDQNIVQNNGNGTKEKS